MRHSQQGHGQGIRDLILDILRRAARPFRKDDDLVFPDVRDGIDRHHRRAVGADERNDDEPQQREHGLANAKPDGASQHD